MSERIVLIYVTSTRHVLAAFTRRANQDAKPVTEDLLAAGLQFRRYRSPTATFQIDVDHLSAGIATVSVLGGMLGTPQDFLVDVSSDGKITPRDLPALQIDTLNHDDVTRGLITIEVVQHGEDDDQDISFWAQIEGNDFRETSETKVAFDTSVAPAKAKAELRFARRPQAGQPYRLLALASNRRPHFEVLAL